MENPEIPKFSSCRGVSFEINNLFKLRTPANEPDSIWAWLHSAPSINTSKSSSHFCDINNENDEEEEEEEEEENVENQEATITKLRRAKETRLSVILLDQGLFTVYKLLFAVSLSLNIVGLVLAMTGHFNYAKQNAALFSISNILALTLCRSEAFLRLVFWSAVKVLGRRWVPLSIKTSTTSFLQCIGGVHSSCGVASLLWLIYSLFLILQKRQNTCPQIIAVASIIIALLSLSSLAAFPLVRHLHHNVFERTHRFAGWTSLALLWLFLFLTLSYNSNSKSYHFHSSTLVKKQELWFTTAITILIILPWVTVKRVPVVTVTTPSGHAILIKFAGGVKPGILGRISRSPLSEWHAFGIISNGRNEHIMLVGAVGDFTKGLVSKPPNHLWIRGVKFAGLPYLVNMYERVVLVATGSGICVFLSFLVQQVRADVYLVWVAKGVEQNFGEEIVGMVNGYGKEKVMVHDTGVLGRPNIGEMSVKAARDWGAQVVVVTSNPEGTKDVVNACKARGIAAFGPIWDS